MYFLPDILIEMKAACFGSSLSMQIDTEQATRYGKYFFFTQQTKTARANYRASSSTEDTIGCAFGCLCLVPVELTFGKFHTRLLHSGCLDLLSIPFGSRRNPGFAEHLTTWLV